MSLLRNHGRINIKCHLFNKINFPIPKRLFSTIRIKNIQDNKFIKTIVDNCTLISNHYNKYYINYLYGFTIGGGALGLSIAVIQDTGDNFKSSMFMALMGCGMVFLAPYIIKILLPILLIGYTVGYTGKFIYK